MRRRDARRGTTEFRYDPAGRLLRQRAAGTLTPEEFAWDAAGNLLDEIERKSRGHVQGNRLRMWQDLRFDYDEWGNVAVKRKGARQVQAFTFDAENRLLKVHTKNGRGEIETRFEYDALGRRIGRTEKTTEAWGTRSHQESVRFVWHGLRMVQEVDPDHVRSYVYSPDAAYTPLARLDVTNVAEVPEAFRTLAMLRPRVLHFHTDQVGAPQEVTDKEGELVWSGQYDAWGKVRRDGTTPRIDQPLRFAGQYADAGTGLHYNTFRYYDPDVGRFISQDPIGLLGGENLYAYAPNPERWMDPWGWCSTKLGNKMGARPGDGMANHHLIPEELMNGGRFKSMFDRLKGMGFDPDGAGNGKFLPGSSQLAKDTGMPGHWSNHGNYTSQIESKLTDLNRIWKGGQVSDTSLALGIKNIQQWASDALDKGQFLTDSITGRLL